MQGRQGGCLLGWLHCYKQKGHRIGIQNLWHNRIRATHCSLQQYRNHLDIARKHGRGHDGTTRSSLHRYTKSPKKCLPHMENFQCECMYRQIPSMLGVSRDRTYLPMTFTSTHIDSGKGCIAQIHVDLTQSPRETSLLL